MYKLLYWLQSPKHSFSGGLSCDVRPYSKPKICKCTQIKIIWAHVMLYICEIFFLNFEEQYLVSVNKMKYQGIH